MSIEDPRQAEIVADFAYLDDWMDRYQYIIDLGRELDPVPEESRTDEHRLYGCQSQVWLISTFDGERLHFLADSDSAIVRGLIALVLQVYSNRTPAEILATEPAFVDEIGLSSHLSATRSNGLHSMLAEIRNHATRAA